MKQEIEGVTCHILVKRSSRRADRGIKQYTEVQYVTVKTKYFIIVCYDSRFCLVDVQALAVYLANAPSQLS